MERYQAHLDKVRYGYYHPTQTSIQPCQTTSLALQLSRLMCCCSKALLWTERQWFEHPAPYDHLLWSYSYSRHDPSHVCKVLSHVPELESRCSDHPNDWSADRYWQTLLPPLLSLHSKCARTDCFLQCKYDHYRVYHEVWTWLSPEPYTDQPLLDLPCSKELSFQDIHHPQRYNGSGYLNHHWTHHTYHNHG